MFSYDTDVLDIYCFSTQALIPSVPSENNSLWPKKTPKKHRLNVWVSAERSYKNFPQMTAVAMVTDSLNVLTWKCLNGNQTAWGQIKGQNRDGDHLISDFFILCRLLPTSFPKINFESRLMEPNNLWFLYIAPRFSSPARWNCSHLRELWNY